MRYYFTMNIDGENADDIIGQVEQGLMELKESVSKRQDPFGHLDEGLLGTGWDLEILED